MIILRVFPNTINPLSNLCKFHVPTSTWSPFKGSPMVYGVTHKWEGFSVCVGPLSKINSINKQQSSRKVTHIITADYIACVAPHCLLVTFNSLSLMLYYANSYFFFIFFKNILCAYELSPRESTSRVSSCHFFGWLLKSLLSLFLVQMG